MNSKLFFSIFLAILAASICLYYFFLWQKRRETVQRSLNDCGKREIGFGAILKDQNALTTG
jgi:hypothetical protein